MRNLRALFPAMAVLAATFAYAVGAQEEHDRPSRYDHSVAVVGVEPSPISADRGADADMSRPMSVPRTGNADHDFASSMLGNHQEDIETARILLDKGHDPELRAMAENILRVQPAEMSALQTWLATHH